LVELVANIYEIWYYLYIRSKYANGYKIKNLVEEFFLSIDSIKKIIYAKNV